MTIEVRIPCADGFTGTRDLGFAGHAIRFATAGIATLAFDDRHFGTSGGEPRQLSVSELESFAPRALAARGAVPTPSVQP